MHKSNPNPSGKPIESATVEELLARNADLLETLIRQRNDWRLSFRNGIIAGLGGVFGATIVVGLLIQVIKPFQQISPIFERIATQLEKGR